MAVVTLRRHGVNVCMTFSAKVRDLLKRHRLSQADLAEAIGTNQPQISRWLEKDRPPQKTALLLRLARSLGTSVDFLIDDAMDEPPAPPELTEDERYLLRTYRNSGIDADTAARRIMERPGSRFIPERERLPGGGEERPGGESGPAKKDAGKAVPKR